MKKSKFTEEKIAFALHQAQTGTSVEEVWAVQFSGGDQITAGTIEL